MVYIAALPSSVRCPILLNYKVDVNGNLVWPKQYNGMMEIVQVAHRAGDDGMASTAMAVLVFEMSLEFQSTRAFSSPVFIIAPDAKV